jgi:hypothetical protein
MARPAVMKSGNAGIAKKGCGCMNVAGHAAKSMQ